MFTPHHWQQQERAEKLVLESKLSSLLTLTASNLILNQGVEAALCYLLGAQDALHSNLNRPEDVAELRAKLKAVCRRPES